jgi:hypothetical protein
MALTDFEILQLGPGQEDASWPYEAQLYFARAVEEKVLRNDDALIRQMLEALEGVVTQVKYYEPITAAIVAARARLEQPCA